MDDAKYMDLIAKYLSGNADVAEKEELMAWVERDPANRAFFEEMIELWSISDNYEEQFATDTAQAWQALDERLFGQEIATQTASVASHKKSSAKIVRLSINKTILRVAAVILLAIVVGIWWFGGFTDEKAEMVIVETAAEERQQLELPDGSTIWLNENTRLSYNQTFDERIVNLKGEAFFDVVEQSGEPFTIFSEGATTKVLGTSFNVRAYPEEPRVEVTVATGKVALRKADNVAEEVILEKGTSGIYDKTAEETAVIETPISNADAWKQQRLDFQDTPMRDVIPALERYFDIEMNVTNERVLNCPVTGTFDRPDIESITGILEFAVNVDIVKQDSSRYLIEGTGCP